MIAPNKYEVIKNINPLRLVQNGFEKRDGCYITKTPLYYYDGTKKPYVNLYVLIDDAEPYLVVQVVTNDGDTYAPFYNPDRRYNNKIYEEVAQNYNNFMDNLVENKILTQKVEDNKVNNIKVNIKKLNKDVEIPIRSSNMAAGYDLYSVVTHNGGRQKIAPHSTVLIDTGIAIEIPDGYFGAIFARSGLAVKNGLRPANCVGVIDSDYRGEIKVALHNDTDDIKYISHGDRIAQLVVVPYLPVNFVEVSDLSDTERGEGGFGSTGK